MIIDKELLINSLLLLFKLKAKNGYVPKIISGKEIYEHYNFHNEEDKNHFFNILCYEKPQLLQVNPGMDISSKNWIDNNYGFKRTLFNSVKKRM